MLQSRYWIFLTNQHNKSKRQVLFELCPCAKKEKSICYTFTDESPHCLLSFWCHLGELFFWATVIRFHSCYHFSTRAHIIRASKWCGRARDEKTWGGEREWVKEVSEQASAGWGMQKGKQSREEKQRAEHKGDRDRERENQYLALRRGLHQRCNYAKCVLLTWQLTELQQQIKTLLLVYSHFRTVFFSSHFC